MNILIVTSEYLHLAKTGGLADAVTVLAEGIARRGHTVDVVMPKYKSIGTESFERLPGPLTVDLGERKYGCAVLSRVFNGVNVHLIEHEVLFRRDGIYGPTASESFDDNPLRFALLARGAFEVSRKINRVPDLLHVHDWPSALAIPYLRTVLAEDPFFRDTRTILSIHNLGFQGRFPADPTLETFGLSHKMAEDAGILEIDGVNVLRGAILGADKIVTVSPTYAREIQQPRYGFDLHTALQLRGGDLSGILNGIDTSIWNPDTDQYIPARYSRSDLRGKAMCKEQLQEELDLPVDPTVPLIGSVTRLTNQKGIDELFGENYGAADRILSELPVQWIILGTGERWCEDRIRALSREYRNFVGLIMYSDTLAHRIEAGSDFFLMPSRYEPCGLNQMYSMRYGTIPIATRTGGLMDTVDSDTGFHIEGHTPDAVFTAVQHAIERFTGAPEEIREMQLEGMKRDFSEDRSIEAYESLYRELTT